MNGVFAAHLKKLIADDAGRIAACAEQLKGFEAAAEAAEKQAAAYRQRAEEARAAASQIEAGRQLMTALVTHLASAKK